MSTFLFLRFAVALPPCERDRPTDFSSPQIREHRFAWFVPLVRQLAQRFGQLRAVGEATNLGAVPGRGSLQVKCNPCKVFLGVMEPATRASCVYPRLQRPLEGWFRDLSSIVVSNPQVGKEGRVFPIKA